MHGVIGRIYQYTYKENRQKAYGNRTGEDKFLIMKILSKLCANLDVQLFSKFFLIGSFVIIFCLRIIGLDADTTNWGILNYQSVDEGVYNYLALNQINFGSINPDFMELGTVKQYTAEHVRTNIIGNLFTFAGIKLLGDNYYGFRISSVICVTLIFLLIFLILIELGKKYTYSNSKLQKFCYLVLLYLSLEFTFLGASRISETSIWRLLIIELVIYISIKPLQDAVKFFLIGFLAVFSVFGIYITNLFFVFSTGVLIVFVLWNRPDKLIRKKIVGFYLLGGCSAVFLCELYFRFFWHTNIVKNVLSILKNFSTVSEYDPSTGIYNNLRLVLLFASSNFNLYNIALFLLFLLQMPFLLSWGIRKKDESIIFLYATYSGLFIQTFITEDYIARKYIIVAPVIIFLLLIFECIKTDLLEILENKFFKIFYLCYFCFCFLFSVLILAFRLFLINDNTRKDIANIDTKIIFSLSLASISFMLLYFFLKYYKCHKKLITICFCTVYILSISSNLYMSCKHIYFNKSYSDKNIMEEINKMNLENKNILGINMLSFCLYNDYIPIVNNYEDMMEMMVKDKTLYYFDYSITWNTGLGDYLNSLLYPYGYKLKIIKEFPREMKTFGINRSMALYTLCPIK